MVKLKTKPSRPAGKPPKSPYETGVHPRVIPPGKPVPPPSPRKSADGKFVAVPPLSADDEADAEARRDDNRLVKFSDVRTAVSALVGGSFALAKVRAKLLFQGNPVVRLRLKKGGMAEALGKGASVAHRVGVGDFGAPLAAIPAVAEKGKRKKGRDSEPLTV